MPTIDWPEALIPQTAQLALRKAGTQFASPFNGTLQALDFIAERWVLSASLAQMAMRNPRGVDAFCNTLAGGVERVRVWPFHTGGAPRGTLRGAPVLTAAAARGHSTLAIGNTSAGGNLFRDAALFALLNTEYGVQSGTATYNTGPGPTAEQQQITLTRTAISPDWFAVSDLPYASTSARSVTIRVWLRRGTLTGDVELIVSDGANGNGTTAFVSPTAEWQQFTVRGWFNNTASPNVRLYINPVEDGGPLGETLFVGAATVEVSEHRPFNATLVMRDEIGPTGLRLGHRLRRAAVGDHSYFRLAGRPVAAGETWTYSVWIRRVLLASDVVLAFADPTTGTYLASTTAATSGAWQRFSLTHTFTAALPDIRIAFDPVVDTGALGDTLGIYGEALTPGAGVPNVDPVCSLLAGDFIGCGGHLFQVAADTQADPAGNMLVPVVNRVRGTIAINSPVTWYRPTCEMVLPAMQAGPVRRPGVIESTALDLVEVW